MRGSAVILTHPHKQERRGERKVSHGRHSWLPSHWLIIREGENKEDGGEGDKEGKVEDERLQGYGDRGERKL